MKTITASEARANLYKLLDETAVTSEPVQITGKRANAVLISLEDWRAIQETLHLLSIPGMRASIRKGMATPVKECLESLDWIRVVPVLKSLRDRRNQPSSARGSYTGAR